MEENKLDNEKTAKCSRNLDENNDNAESNIQTEHCEEKNSHSTTQPQETLCLNSLSFRSNIKDSGSTPGIPLLIVSKNSNGQWTNSMVPMDPNIYLDLPSSVSFAPHHLIQPQSLFLQALSKLNESSISLVLTNPLKSNYIKNPEISPPDSIISAPPSYSFVLRQATARRRLIRPRLMGTFIPSPSFIQHTPPPNYNAAFDIYIDNAIHVTTPRSYNFGFAPMPIVCPECGYRGLSTVVTKITVCTHLCAVILCIFCCWICAPLPYLMSSCKDVYHYCRNCRCYLGMFCPTNPENPYSIQ